MERGTAEVLKECLQRNAAVSPWIQAFRWRCRASCTDKAGYNLKADSSIARDRGTQWAALKFNTDCEVHWQCTSTCFQKTYEGLLPDQVSGLICCACPWATHRYYRLSAPASKRRSAKALGWSSNEGHHPLMLSTTRSRSWTSSSPTRRSRALCAGFCWRSFLTETGGIGSKCSTS